METASGMTSLHVKQGGLWNGDVGMCCCCCLSEFQIYLSRGRQTRRQDCSSLNRRVGLRVDLGSVEWKREERDENSQCHVFGEASMGP